MKHNKLKLHNGLSLLHPQLHGETKQPQKGEHPVLYEPVLLGGGGWLIPNGRGNGKGPSVVLVGAGTMQASCQAGSSEPDPWEGLKGE